MQRDFSTQAASAACHHVGEKFQPGKGNVTTVAIGLKRRNGKLTNEIGVIVGVKSKLPIESLRAIDIVPPTVRVNGEEIPTDIQEFEPKAGPPFLRSSGAAPQEFTQKMRPAPAGISCGHWQITAGTIGAWVHYGPNNEKFFLLSNNHVIANSNEASPGDRVLQPGPVDGGSSDASAIIANLREYAEIRFNTPGGGKKKMSRALWKAWLAVTNLAPKMVGCDYRARVSRPQVIEQPFPNLVDAAIAEVTTNEFVDPKHIRIGQVEGVVDGEIGMRVQKVGRTTEHTFGIIEAIDGETSVNYGAGKGLANFAEQLFIRGESGGDFSAGGDSGSLIVTADPPYRAVGLLFAGGGGITVANRIRNVISLLGVRLSGA